MKIIKFNSKIEQPEDKEIYLKDIIKDGVVDRDKSYCIDANYHKGGNLKSYFEKSRRQLVFNKVKYEIIKKSYQKRVNKISNEFNKYLKESRGSLTYKEIATNLNLPLTQVEHYFRTDKSRAIPSVDNYKKIKELLNLNNKWDSLVMEFETKQSTYEQNLRLYNINGKSPTLTLSCNVPIKLDNYIIRILTPTECCRLQGFPDDYVSMVSKTQGYKGLGNSFTVPVIKHILTNLKNKL